MNRYFYQSNHLAAICGKQQARFLRYKSSPFAQLGAAKTKILSSGVSGSVFASQSDGQGLCSFTYAPYGWCHSDDAVDSGLRFNGEWPESVAGLYMLGNGRRGFSVTLMRFVSPDNVSPFGEGGINSYAYCANDPVGKVDPSGKNGVSKLKHLAVNAIPQQQRYQLKKGGVAQNVYKDVSKEVVPVLKGLKKAVAKGDLGEVFSVLEEKVTELRPEVFNITMAHYEDAYPGAGEFMDIYSAGRTMKLLSKADGKAVPVLGVTTNSARMLIDYNKKVAQSEPEAREFASKIVKFHMQTFVGMIRD